MVPSVTTPTWLLEPLPLCLSHGCKAASCVDELDWVCLHQNQLLWLPSFCSQSWGDHEFGSWGLGYPYWNNALGRAPRMSYTMG